MSFTNEQDEILIDFVQKHEILYDVKHTGFRKTDLKNSLWSEIGKILNKRDTDCSKRWTYVRDYYIRHKGILGKVLSRESVKKRCDLLSFLDTRRSPIKKSTSIDFVNVKEEDVSYLDTEEIDALESEEDPQKDSSVYLEAASETSYGSEIDNSRQPKKIRTISPSEDRLHLLPQITKTQDYHEKNETDLFFESITIIVKKLPELERARLRMEIGNLVGKAEMKNISQLHPHQRHCE